MIDVRFWAMIANAAACGVNAILYGLHGGAVNLTISVVCGLLAIGIAIWAGIQPTQKF